MFRVTKKLWDYRTGKVVFEKLEPAFYPAFSSKDEAWEAIDKEVNMYLDLYNKGREKVPVEDSDGNIISYEYPFRRSDTSNYDCVLRFWDGDDYKNMAAYDIIDVLAYSDGENVTEASGLAKADFIKYRGMWIYPNKTHTSYTVESRDTTLFRCKALNTAFERIDEFNEAFLRGKNDTENTKYDICVYGYCYSVEADNENEAMSIACDIYYEEHGLRAYPDDDAVCWKIQGEYPYEWK